MKKETVSDPRGLPYVVGIDLGGTQMRVAVVRGAQLCSRISEETGSDSSPEGVLPRLSIAIQKALDACDCEWKHIKGIGIAVAGPLDSQKGIVFATPNLANWENVPLRDILQEQYRVPIYLGNDANVAALGEQAFGAGRGCKNVIYLTISTGIGSGIILNGQLVEGFSGTAGELGHMTINWQGEDCSCGNIGCLESMASGTAIARRAREAIMDGRGADFLAFVRHLRQEGDPADEHLGTEAGNEVEVSSINARVVFQAAQVNIPLARAIIYQAAQALGFGLVNILHIFNPEVIILGGGVTQMGDLLLQPALQIVHQYALAAPRSAVRIVPAYLNEDAGLIGAGVLVYRSLRLKSQLSHEESLVRST